MNYIIKETITGIILAGISYFIFVKQAIRFKRDWKKTFNEEHPDIKNPYTKLRCILFPIAILISFVLLGIFGEYITTPIEQRHICITSLQEWTEQSGLFTRTSFHAYIKDGINEGYHLIFERPNQHKEGDCFTIYKYSISGWSLKKY